MRKHCDVEKIGGHLSFMMIWQIAGNEITDLEFEHTQYRDSFKLINFWIFIEQWSKPKWWIRDLITF